MQFVIYFFILELFFGLNGKWLVFGGISIRHWLFVVVLVSVYGKALCYVIKKWKEKKSVGVSFKGFLKEELCSFSGFDWCLFAFVLLHSIWIVWIPYTQLETNPSALISSLSSGLSISFVALYFPAVYLLRNGQVKWQRYRKFVMGCCIALGVWHLFIYAAETMQWEMDHSVYFMERVMNAWSDLVGRFCEPVPVVMPMYSVRIIYTCSVYILFAFYFVMGRSGKKYWLWALLNILAIYTTGTRALLVALVAGLIVYFIADSIVYHYSKEKWKKLLFRSLIVVVVAVLLDVAMFQGRSITRLLSSFSFSQDVIDSGQPKVLTWDSSEYSAQNEIKGTTNSNSTRILQIKYYIAKFLEKPIWGHGFAMQSEMDRDMQGLVYLAKVGLVGIVFCLLFFLYFCKRVFRMEKKRKGSGLPALYLVVAILTDIQLQTMFGSLTMSMAVFMFLDLEHKELQIQEKNDEKVG